MTTLTKRVQRNDMCDLQNWIIKVHADSTLFTATLAHVRSLTPQAAMLEKPREVILVDSAT